MWHSFVSIAEKTINQTFFVLIDVFWRHPAVGAAFLVAFAVLTVMFLIALLKVESSAANPTVKPGAARTVDVESAREIRLR